MERGMRVRCFVLRRSPDRMGCWYSRSTTRPVPGETRDLDAPQRGGCEQGGFYHRAECTVLVSRNQKHDRLPVSGYGLETFLKPTIDHLSEASLRFLDLSFHRPAARSRTSTTPGRTLVLRGANGLKYRHATICRFREITLDLHRSSESHLNSMRCTVVLQLNPRFTSQ
jgi:hypothetical protein